ncbi:uncharacterized protein LOC131844070 [Achroia grisella]|uniref:uncharacterized protein LOC131844070 n=1 Tax=Achroia grisella TaxID=688607 RepID=UPI0027D26150|nr:uncharacterized protein LOC131844070 [Achroia grisella]
MYHYIQFFQEQKYTELMLPVALRLLPAAVVSMVQDAPESAPPLPQPYYDMFNVTRHYTVDEAEGSSLGALSCRAVCHAVGGPGAAAARAWRAAAPPRAARLLAGCARRAVSPALVSAQLSRVVQAAPRVPGLSRP